MVNKEKRSFERISGGLETTMWEQAGLLLLSNMKLLTLRRIMRQV